MNNICPICKIRPIYKKTKTVKEGYTEEYLPRQFKFIVTGTKQVTDEWWSCKWCAKHVPIAKYNMKCVEYYNSLWKEQSTNNITKTQNSLF
jgi:hypothetical protein